MRSLPILSLRGALATAIVAAAAALLWTAQIQAQITVYGLWRDPQGGLWCGGSCSEGQACCSITPLVPHTPG